MLHTSGSISSIGSTNTPYYTPFLISSMVSAAPSASSAQRGVSNIYSGHPLVIYHILFFLHVLVLVRSTVSITKYEYFSAIAKYKYGLLLRVRVFPHSSMVTEQASTHARTHARATPTPTHHLINAIGSGGRKRSNSSFDTAASSGGDLTFF